MDDRFEAFLTECVGAIGEDYIDVPEEMRAPHRFSRPFRQKMNKLIRQPSSSFSILKVPRKRRLSMAFTLMALIFLSLVTVANCAGRNIIAGFYADFFVEYVFLRNKHEENALKQIEEVYMPTWLPEGYELIEVHNEAGYPQFDYFYCNDPDCDNHNRTNNHIDFTQTLKEKYSTNFDNEDSVIVPITVNEQQGIEIEFECRRILVWNNDNYTFEVSDPVDSNKNDVMKIAESVQKIESD